jgi:hypothetical protein
MGNFVDNDHALVTGFVVGTLMRAGISAYPVVDNNGDYIPVIRMRLDVGDTQPRDVILEVRAAPKPE